MKGSGARARPCSIEGEEEENLATSIYHAMARGGPSASPPWPGGCTMRHVFGAESKLMPTTRGRGKMAPVPSNSRFCCWCLAHPADDPRGADPVDRRAEIPAFSPAESSRSNCSAHLHSLVGSLSPTLCVRSRRLEKSSNDCSELWLRACDVVTRTLAPKARRCASISSLHCQPTRDTF